MSSSPKSASPRPTSSTKQSASQSPQKAAPAQEVRDPAEESRKVYIGNLSSTSTEESVTTYFAKVGAVENVIVRHRFFRGQRIPGYAFVMFQDVANVARAIETCHHTELDGRTINVEPVTARPPRERKPRKVRPRGQSNSSDNAEAQPEAVLAQQQSIEDGSTAKPKQPRRNRRKSKTTDETPAPAGKAGAPIADVEAADAEAQRKLRAARQTARKTRAAARKAELQAHGIKSTDTIFVGNLSYRTSEDQITEFFTSRGLSVVKTTIRQSSFGRSRGFGFVQFKNDSDQIRAVEECNDEQFEGRTLQVRVALVRSNENEDSYHDAHAPEKAASSPTNASAKPLAASPKPTLPKKNEK